MSATRNPVQWLARLVVDAVRAAAHHRLALSSIGLVVVLIGSLAYVSIGALRINPVNSTVDVEVLLVRSGGLLPNQEVTLRGDPIGRVKSINFTATGVVAVATLDADVRVPHDSDVRVSALSAAGEQYLDFRPTDDLGPPLTDGSVIQESQTRIPVSVADILNHGGALAQLDPKKIATIVDEFRAGPLAPEKLAAIFDGGTFLISTLGSVLPETVSLLRTSRVVLTTLSDVGPGLHAASTNLHEILQGVDAMDGGFRQIVDRGRGQLKLVDDIIADNSATMVQLLGNMTTISQLAYVRMPALKALFSSTRGSVLDAVTSTLHDGGVWAIADLYPRYSCDYNFPRRPPSLPDFPEPYLNADCTNPDPSVLVRGARNAPLLPGEEPAGPPPGHDPLAQTNPTPTGPN